MTATQVWEQRNQLWSECRRLKVEIAESTRLNACLNARLKDKLEKAEAERDEACRGAALIVADRNKFHAELCEARRQVDALCVRLDVVANCPKPPATQCPRNGACRECWRDWSLAEARKANGPEGAI